MMTILSDLARKAEIAHFGLRSCVRYFMGTGEIPEPEDMSEAVGAAQEVMDGLKKLEAGSPGGEEE